MGGVVIILILGILIVAVVLGVIGWMSGWWLTTATDARGEPGARDEQRGRPAHTAVEDEADAEITGEPEARR